MSAQKRALAASLAAVPYTCPAVDWAILKFLKDNELDRTIAGALEAEIKSCTEALRAAHVDALVELEALQDELTESKGRVAELERQVESLQEELEEAAKDAAAAEAG